MPQTVVGVNHPTARKLYSVATFAASQRQASFRKILTGPAPSQSDAERKLKGQTSPDYPFVSVNDLSKTAGDKVTVDMFNIITGKPTMGDRKLAGNMSALTSETQEISINQYRKGVDPGGRMTQQRTLNNLRTIATANLAGYQNRLEDELALVHLAGARGFQTGADWHVPLETDPDFDEIMVNDVLPPSPNRRIMAEVGSTSIASLDATDFLTLNTIDRVRAIVDDMAFPLQAIRLAGDPLAAGMEDPLYCMLVSSRQWHFLQTSTDTQNWRNFLAQAYERAKGWNHPLFLGTTGVWNGIVVKKMTRCIRFPAGSSVREYAANGTTINTVTTAVDCDRALLLGAQALANVYGRHQKSDYYYSWHEEETDHGNTIEFSVAAMGGKSKLKFNDMDGVPTDWGVIAIDSYAPDPLTV